MFDHLFSRPIAVVDLVRISAPTGIVDPLPSTGCLPSLQEEITNMNQTVINRTASERF
jgi:hypothetical protein